MKAVVLGAGAVAACRSVTPTPRRFAKGLRKCAEALQENDPATAEVGLRRLSAARRSVASLNAEIQAARNAARWSLRGRFAAREIGAAAQRYDCKANQLYASTLLLGQALASALREVNVCVPNAQQATSEAHLNELQLTTGLRPATESKRSQCGEVFFCPLE